MQVELSVTMTGRRGTEQPISFQFAALNRVSAIAPEQPSEKTTGLSMAVATTDCHAGKNANVCSQE